MNCSCHINPPCPWCVELYECIECGKWKHPSESEPDISVADFTARCSNCVHESIKDIAKIDGEKARNEGNT